MLASCERRLPDGALFIAGCNNSGTTIVQQALLTDPRFSGPSIDSQDVEGMPRVLTHFLGPRTFRLWMHPEFEYAYRMTGDHYTPEVGRGFVSAIHNEVMTGTYWVFKSPADLCRFRLLRKISRHALRVEPKFLVIVRNGFAVVEGTIRKRLFDPDRPRPELRGLTTTVEQAATHWFRAAALSLAQPRLLGEEHCRLVRYEDLVTDPRGVMSDLLDWLHVPITGFPIPRWDTDRNEQQVDCLTPDDIKTITRIAGPMLDCFGYLP